MDLGSAGDSKSTPSCSPQGLRSRRHQTWQQRAWAVVLHVDAGPIHVAVERARTVLTPDGVRLHRLADLDDRALWNLSPPRLRVEEAVLDVAAAAADHTMVRTSSHLVTRSQHSA